MSGGTTADANETWPTSRQTSDNTLSWDSLNDLTNFYSSTSSGVLSTKEIDHLIAEILKIPGQAILPAN